MGDGRAFFPLLYLSEMTRSVKNSGPVVWLALVPLSSYRELALLRGVRR